MMSISDARRGVHDACTEAMSWADNAEARTLWEFERHAWDLVLAFGRALVVLFLVRQSARPRPATYHFQGVHWHLTGEVTSSELATRFGRVDFTRPVGRRSKRKMADYLIDRELGLCSGFSLCVVLGIARLCAQLSFAASRATWKDIYGWAPSSRAVLRMVDGVGGLARQFIEESAAPEDDGDVLVVLVDAGGAQMIGEVELERRKRRKRKTAPNREERRAERAERKSPRKKKGKPRNKKQAFVATLHTLRKQEDGTYDGPINKRVIGTFESHEALFVWLEREARKRGYGHKTTLFLADGSEHIWRLQAQYLPEAQCCLDWYHLIEKIWKAGRAVHKEGSKVLASWVDEQKQRLRAGEVDAVLEELRVCMSTIPRTGPGTKWRREALEGAMNYIEEHRGRMPYQSFIEQGFDIGSGAVEGAIRNVVRKRLDGPRWGRERAEFVLHLRCILVSNQWDAFHQWFVRQQMRLDPQPHPASTEFTRAAA